MSRLTFQKVIIRLGFAVLLPAIAVLVMMLVQRHAGQVVQAIDENRREAYEDVASFRAYIDGHITVELGVRLLASEDASRGMGLLLSGEHIVHQYEPRVHGMDIVEADEAIVIAQELVRRGEELRLIIQMIEDERVRGDHKNIARAEIFDRQLKDILRRMGAISDQLMLKEGEVASILDHRITEFGAQVEQAQERASSTTLTAAITLMALMIAGAIWFGRSITGVVTELSEFTEDLARAKRDAELMSLDLSESEERLSLAVCGSRDGLWDWDLQNNRVYYASRWKELLGYKDDEISEIGRASCRERV